MRAFRYRLYPTKAQETALLDTLRLTRELYNAALQERRDAYRKVGRSVSVYEQMRSLPEVKAVRPEFKRVHAHVLQGVVTQLDRAFQGFFRRVKQGVTAGYPRFKGQDRWNSFAFKQVWDNSRNTWFGPGKVLDTGRIYLPNIGNVRMKMHRPMEGKPKTLTIKKEGNEWYAVYVCDAPTRPLPDTGSAVGLDLGTAHFLITSDGEFVDNPRFLQSTLKKLRVAQRSLSRKKRGSKRRRKAKQHVASIHRKVAQQRLDFHHKAARTLVNHHDLIAHEDLNVKGMGQGNLARSIHDVGWGQFLNLLSLKAADAGRRVIGVDPRFTSQRCHACGHTEKANRRSQAMFVCVSCGHEANADHNAAKNVLGRAVPSGLNGRGQPHAVV
ncbi:transposase (plasmid) [Deinococcus wulumuqiensis]|uniref:Transposase n=1 Tax=Deinococcus wulumuqiensis TaxID=980427 RepID=A0A345IMQ2_9DEIO|nr:RNA-guided endonuclease TnpB family protein [Deinococcus wulumuqiensis]AXH00975.1 transposase [Deinococcus wulumuqiensis]